MQHSRKRWGLEVLAALAWCLVTLATDRLFFRYDWRTPAFFVYKALFVLAALAVIHGAVTLVENCAAGTISRCGGFSGRCPTWR